MFQRLLDKHAFQSRIIKTLEELWKSKASDRRTARRLGTNLRFKGFLNLMEADDSQHGQGIEAHVDSDVAIGAVVVCLNWDGISLGLYEVDEQGQRHYVDIPKGTAVWVNGGCVHGVELSHPSDDSPRDIQHFRLPRCSCRPDAFGSIPSSIAVKVAGVSC